MKGENACEVLNLAQGKFSVSVYCHCHPPPHHIIIIFSIIILSLLGKDKDAEECVFQATVLCAF